MKYFNSLPAVVVVVVAPNAGAVEPPKLKPSQIKIIQLTNKHLATICLILRYCNKIVLIGSPFLEIHG